MIFTHLALFSFLNGAGAQDESEFMAIVIETSKEPFVIIINDQEPFIIQETSKS